MPDRRLSRNAVALAAVLTGLSVPTRAQTTSAAISNVITVTPSATVRGSSFEVDVQNAPPGATNVTVQLDGRKVPSQLPNPQLPGAIRASVPDTTDPSSTDFIPLGTHHVSVTFDGRWFTGGTTLTVVRPAQTTPVLQQASPLEIGPHQASRRLVLTGSGFLTRPADDNQIVLGGFPLPVVWDGCDHPSNWAKDRAGSTHGAVDPSGTTITLCNFPVSRDIAPEIQVRQGIAESNLLALHVPPWPKSVIVFASLCINLIAAALVIFLASFVPKIRIGNDRYGMFRILFLDPETNTYSLSKYQFYMWTGAAVFTYAYLAISRIFVQQQLLPDVPSTLPAIIGIGAGTAIGSQIVTGIRGPKGGGQEKPSLGDFVTSGGVAAADRVQMFVWTTLGVFAFCLATLRANPWEITALPQVGTGLMYLMGLSSIGYLGGKLARKPGPVLSEISISPAHPDDASPANQPPALTAPLSLPAAASQQVLQQVQAKLGAITSTSSPAAFTAAQDALKALRSSIAAAASPVPDVLNTLGENAILADAAAQTAAAEFTRLADADPSVVATTDSDSDDTRQLAEIAQEAAAATQDLATGSAQTAGLAQAAAAAPIAPGLSVRNINLRGRNLSLDATFEINDLELPFRMLAPVNGARAPRMVAPEDDTSLPNMARELRLTIAPDGLGSSDLASYKAWFSTSVKSLCFTITNPDGQRSEITLSVPPGSGQASG